MQNSAVETLIAAAVVAVAVGFLLFAYRTTNTGSLTTYEVDASLYTVDGIAKGDDVRLHGIKIGTVSSIDLNHKNFRPLAHLAIRDDIHIPEDSHARVASTLANGNPYLSVQPGHSTRMLAPGAFWTAN